MLNLTQRHLVERGVEDVPIPRFVLVRQRFPAQTVQDIPSELDRQWKQRDLYCRIHSGQRVAITAGSRQIANMPTILRSIADAVKSRGAHPFIIPAMGSHGAATAEGQLSILNHYGITEESTGCPIISSMDTVQIGMTEDGTPVFCSRTLCDEADAIILCNRIKPHPGLAGKVQSGLIKMSVIGCGKQRGAAECHRRGLDGMEERLIACSRVVLERMPVIFGVGIIENAYDQTAELHCIPAERIHEEEPALLQRAASYMPAILPDRLDVLFVDEGGKNISGVCADPAVTLRYLVPEKIAQNRRKPPSVFILGDLTEESEGAASGIGQADIITDRLLKKVDLGKTYVNAMTSTFLLNSRIPLVMRNDRFALKLAIRTCNAPQPDRLRIVRIRNTLRLSEIYVSEALAEEMGQDPRIEILSPPMPLSFDEEGNLLPFAADHHMERKVSK